MIKIRILLVDDHRIMRDGLASLLERQADMEVIQHASDGFQAVNLSRELKPHVIVMDLIMPNMNGVDATRRITGEVPKAKVLCLSVHGDTRFVSAALDAGASGYLLKECAFDELALAIRTVMKDQIYLSSKIISVLVEDYKILQPKLYSSAFSKLTQREREIVQLLAEGGSCKEIAARLKLSIKTVGSHRENIMSKLNLRSLAAVTKYAIREGLTSVDF